MGRETLHPVLISDAPHHCTHCVKTGIGLLITEDQRLTRGKVSSHSTFGQGRKASPGTASKSEIAGQPDAPHKAFALQRQKLTGGSAAGCKPVAVVEAGKTEGNSDGGFILLFTSRRRQAGDP
jgi:hypothetical protein